jgi:PIN domain
MVRQSSGEQHHPAERLASRHIFLDTQVYRALGHNPANRALALLKEQVNSHRVVLHTTDITLLEVQRQIRERVLARQRELTEIERDLAQWRKSAPKAAPAIEFDAEALSTELFRQFEWFLRHECQAEVHRALAVAPAAVFETYFDRKPPFDKEVSKEFPDAFVIEALRQWCREQGDRTYVVTEDKAMTRAVSADGHLLALKDIHEVLTRVISVSCGEPRDGHGTRTRRVLEITSLSPPNDRVCMTLRWREMDSNIRYRERCRRSGRLGVSIMSTFMSREISKRRQEAAYLSSYTSSRRLPLKMLVTMIVSPLT